MFKANRRSKVFVSYEFQIQPGLRETKTIKTDGLEADDDGRIYARKGSFVDKDGKVITLSDGGSELTFSADPYGIITEDLNLTYGKQAGSVLRSGTIDPQYLNYPEGVTYKDAYAASIEAKMPHILCIHSNAPQSFGSGAAAAASVDLSKATGTLAVAHGGTGATDATGAKKNLEISS